MRFPLSLRARLQLIVASVFIPVATFTWVSAQRDRTDADAQIRRQLVRALDAAADEHAALVQETARALSAWAEVGAVRSGSVADCRDALRRLRVYAPQIRAVLRLDAAGTIDCVSAARAPLVTPVAAGGAAEPLDTTLTTMLRRAAEVPSRTARLAATTGRLIPESPTHPAMLPISQPLVDGAGRRVGTLVAGMELPWITQLVTAAGEAGLSDGASFAIVDTVGRLYLRIPRSDAVGTVVPGIARALRADRAKGSADRGDLRVEAVDGVERLLSYRSIVSSEQLPAYVSIGVPASVAFAVPNARLRNELTILVLTIVLAALLAWALADALVLRHLAALLRATKRVAAGDLSVRTGVSEGAGEIGELAASFDTMTATLALRTERMRQAERMEALGRLAGGVAHDFNNLLTAIVSASEVARDSLPAGHPALADLDVIRNSATRSRTLTRKLLSFSRPTAPSGPAQPLDGLTRDVAALLARLLPRTIHLEVQVATTRLTRVDAAQFEQAMLNLAINARDAMAGRGRLSIVVDDADGEPPVVPADGLLLPEFIAPDDGQWVRVRVRDDGPGMAAALKARVFEPFFTTKLPGEGTGLGLPMVFGMMQQHGGRVQLDSEEGQGTTVTLWFPAVEAAGDAMPRDDRRSDTGHIAEPGRSPDGSLPSDVARPSAPDVRARVLLVEDQDVVGRLITRLLVRAGYDVLRAESRAAALALFESYAFDVLVTDYELPDGTGGDVMMTLRAQQPALPVVIISGYARDGWPSALFAAPHTAFVAKPFEVPQLLEALAHVRERTPAPAA